MGFIALAASGVFLTLGSVLTLVDDLSISGRFHSAAPCAGTDRDDLDAACLHRTTAVVASSDPGGSRSHAVRVTLKGHDPIGGDVTLDDPPVAFYHLHSGDHVTVTVWSRTITAMTVRGHTHRTEDSPEFSLLLDGYGLVVGAAMSLGGTYMVWMWFFRRGELSDDLSELKVAGRWVVGQCALVFVLGFLNGYNTLTVFLILWGALTVPMSLYSWMKLRYD
ncbi:hypothetical protein [Streptomyces sp. NPDC096324]|uniref:hypothetical protein n=1 Tax=Streptomyces sp. NPDC096324 TaxID=3366085 RepID=UPI003813B177